MILYQYSRVFYFCVKGSYLSDFTDDPRSRNETSSGPRWEDSKHLRGGSKGKEMPSDHLCLPTENPEKAEEIMVAGRGSGHRGQHVSNPGFEDVYV